MQPLRSQCVCVCVCVRRRFVAVRDMCLSLTIGSLTVLPSSSLCKKCLCCRLRTPRGMFRQKPSLTNADTISGGHAHTHTNTHRHTHALKMTLISACILKTNHPVGSFPPCTVPTLSICQRTLHPALISLNAVLIMLTQSTTTKKYIARMIS